MRQLLPRRIERELRRHVRNVRRRYRTDSGVAIKTDLAGESHTLLITFGGLGAGRGPGFEFESTAQTLAVKRIFVTDLDQSWYHRAGAAGEAIVDVARLLAERIPPEGVGRLVTIGNSAGGYAALIFGTLLGADEVISFAPQTVLAPALLAEIDDHRWDPILLPLAAKGVLEERWLDLRVALPAERKGDVRYRIYFDETIACDRLHAERLRGLPGTRFYRFGRGGHRLVRDLRDLGALRRLLARACGVENEEPPQTTRAIGLAR